jgi:hypothetical protein
MITVVLLLVVCGGCRAPDMAAGLSTTSSNPPSPSSMQPGNQVPLSMVGLVARGQYAQAIGLFEESYISWSEEVPVRDVIAYLDALAASGQDQYLIRFLMHDRRPSSYDRDIFAWNLIHLGDLHLEKGDSEAALLEGYLKACLLFSEGTCMRRRALEKTIDALQLQNDARAAQFRKVLEEEFPQRKRPEQPAGERTS